MTLQTKLHNKIGISKMVSPKESDVHKQVCEYLRIQYPNVIFHTDYAAGLKMTIGQAVRSARLQSGKGWPDLFIAEISNRHGLIYCGLFLEIKKEGTKVYKKQGGLVSNTHIQNQKKMLDSLEAKGYYTAFGIGFEQCKKIIDNYLKG